MEINLGKLRISCWLESKLRKLLVKWQDEDAFFSDYAASHKKLSELGFTPPSSSLKAITKNRTLLAQSAVGVAVAATVIILSYFYEINRRV